MTATAIIGGQWGSEGKGVVAASLAERFDVAVRVGGPNAGHSFYHDHQRHVMRGVPCAWTNKTCDLVIGAGAVVDPALMARELNALPGHVRVIVDKNAAVVTDIDADVEKASGLWEAIGSTNEGVGQSRMRKMDRRREPAWVLARDWDEWHPHVTLADDTEGFLAQTLRAGGSVMLEGTQGSGLSLHHGTEWPFMTSADTNVSGLAADAGIAPSHIKHTFLVARTLPIRVAGNSGPMGEELDWMDLLTHVGLAEPERTTVTKRVRRISRWDDGVFQRAIDVNAPCGVFLMFADYLVPSMAGVRDAGALLDAAADAPNVLGDLRELTALIEETHRVPVVAYGTGGREWELAHRGACAHGDRWDAPK